MVSRPESSDSMVSERLSWGFGLRRVCLLVGVDVASGKSGNRKQETRPQRGYADG
jgi:hypothetical protein